LDVKYSTSGKLCEKDYLKVIGSNKYNLSTTDLENLSAYLIEKGMIQTAVGDQYKQDVMRQVQNPSNDLVKDTKGRTHVNKDKYQKSKKKKEEDVTEKQADASEGWDRFDSYSGMLTWDYVVETDLENSTEEEQQAVMSLGYYGTPITSESIDRIKQGLAYEPSAAYTIVEVCADGIVSSDFDSLTEVKKYVLEVITNAHNITEDGFGTDYCNYTFENFSLSELNLDDDEVLSNEYAVVAQCYYGKSIKKFESIDSAETYLIDVIWSDRHKHIYGVKEDGFSTSECFYRFKNFTLSDTSLSDLLNSNSVKDNTASFHLNTVIDSLKEFEDEFLPAWKKFKASGDVDPAVLSAAFMSLLAQDFSNYEQGQRSVLTLLDAYATSIPENAVFDNPVLQSMFLKVDPNTAMTVVQRLTAAIARIYDPSVLRELYTELSSALQSNTFKTETEEAPEDWRKEPERTLDFGESDDPALELDMTTASKRVAAHNLSVTAVRVGDHEFSALVAEDAMAKAAGLEVVDGLDDGEGMLFPFYPQQQVTFHMGAVDFPIDILFLLDDGNDLIVGDVIEDAKPGTSDKWTSKAKYVLELKGGTAEELCICKGTVCKIDAE